MPGFKSATDSLDVDYWRRRVGLFLQVLLTIDVIAYVSDYVSPLLIDGLTVIEAPLATHLYRSSGTAIVAAGWLFTRFGRPGRGTLAVIESVVTVWLALVYIQVASTYMTGDEAQYGPIFVMFGYMMLLSLRAALVPSPVTRTVAIGVATMAGLFIIGRDAVSALAPRVLDGVTFMAGASVLSTGVTSHVIYGLRREVRQAQQLGQYTLDEKLGEGGMGTVFRARHALLRRQAAVKLVRPEIAAGGSGHGSALQRFEREAHVTASLQSPHTIELYDFGVADDGAFYYVMELLDGINLDVAIEKYGPMPAARVAGLLLQVCESLEEAHAAGLVHRDIKPANIFVCQYGLRYDFVKVLDFGLVALAPQQGETHTKLTAQNVTAGTPAYLAPEAATTPEAVDARTDIYGIGCVAYRLLTGQAPFERSSPMATILAHVNETPEPPSRASKLPIPPAIDALVLDCLAKDPAQRPASAAALSSRLAAAVDRGAWGQPEAKQWWDTHRPTRAPVAPAVAGSATMTVMRAWGDSRSA